MKTGLKVLDSASTLQSRHRGSLATVRHVQSLFESLSIAVQWYAWASDCYSCTVSTNLIQPSWTSKKSLQRSCRSTRDRKRPAPRPDSLHAQETQSTR